MCIQDYFNIWRLIRFGFWTTVAISNGMNYVIASSNVLFNLISSKQSISLILPEALINCFCVKWNWTLLLCLLSFFSVLLAFCALYCIFCCHFSLQIWSNITNSISLIHCHDQWSVNFAVWFVMFSLPWLL